MRYAIVGLLGLGLGIGASWLYLGLSFSTASQFHYENSLANTIRYVELLDEQGGDELRQTLVGDLPCALSVYRESLESPFWERTENSEDLIRSAARYTQGKGCPEDL